LLQERCSLLGPLLTYLAEEGLHSIQVNIVQAAASHKALIPAAAAAATIRPYNRR
jgi:hypothetical protein